MLVYYGYVGFLIGDNTAHVTWRLCEPSKDASQLHQPIQWNVTAGRPLFFHCEKKVICTLRDGPADDCEAAIFWGANLVSWKAEPTDRKIIGSQFLPGKNFFSDDSPGWSFFDDVFEVLDISGGVVAPNMDDWGRQKC